MPVKNNLVKSQLNLKIYNNQMIYQIQMNYKVFNCKNYKNNQITKLLNNYFKIQTFLNKI